MKLTAAQQLMRDDGAPDCCFATAEERAAAWVRNPPKPVVPFIDPQYAVSAALRAQQKKEKQADQLKKFKDSKRGLKYDQKSRSWIPDDRELEDEFNFHAQENDDMPKIKITALDKDGQEVARGCTSMPETATAMEIAAKAQHAFKRGGKAVATIDAYAPDGTLAGSWAREEQALAPTATEQAVDEPPVATEEVMAKKKSKVKKAKGDGTVRSGSKTNIIYKLLKRDTGCTSKQVLEATGWPAVSMPAMAKACGLKLRKEKVKGEVTRYFGS